MRHGFAAFVTVVLISGMQASAESLPEQPVLLATAEAKCAAIGFSLAIRDTDDQEAWAQRGSELFQKAGTRLMEVARTQQGVETLEKYGNLGEFYALHPDFLAGMMLSGIFEDATNSMAELQPHEQRASWRVQNCEVIAAFTTD